MRSSKSRSRNKNRNQRSLGNVVNRVFDSSGPEGKVRGTPQQIIEKYLALARDAQLSGDRVAEQSFLQHAEHYTRMLGEAQREQAERQAQFGGPGGFDDRDGAEPRRDDYRNGDYRNGDGRNGEGRNGEGRGDQRGEQRRDEHRNDQRRDDQRTDQRRDDQRTEQRTEQRRDDQRGEGRGERDQRRDDRAERSERGERPERTDLPERREDRRDRPAPQPQNAPEPVAHDLLPDFLKAPVPGMPEALALSDEPTQVDTPEAQPDLPRPELHPDAAEADAPGAHQAGGEAEPEAPRARRRRAPGGAAEGAAPAPRRAPRKRTETPEAPSGDA